MLAQVADMDPIIIVMFLTGLAAMLLGAAGLVCVVVGLVKKRKVLWMTGLGLFGVGVLVSMAVTVATLI
jgi:hypothetical protein